MEIFPFEWDHGRGEVQSLAGMLGPITFDLDGRQVQPMAIAPWSEDTGPAHDALPDILKRLRGEWPCVPFGAPEAPEGLPEEWAGIATNGTGSAFHGHSSHAHWRKIRDLPTGLELAIDYPEDHGIRRLTRRIEGIPGAARVEITLTIEPRSDVTLPIALHPVFRLPEEAGQATLAPGPFRLGRSFPMPVELGSVFTPNAVFDDLTSVPSARGPVDLTALPLPFDTEELVQLCGAKGTVTLAHPAEGFSARLDYDPEVFPSLLLWVSNRGRSAYPWNSRHLALGIEPVRGAFDLGPEIGANPENPIAKAGISTALELTKGQAFSTRYAISVAPL